MSRLTMWEQDVEAVKEAIPRADCRVEWDQILVPPDVKTCAALFTQEAAKRQQRRDEETAARQACNLSSL